MAGIQLSGLASGLDWKSLVDQIVQVNSIPKTRMQAEQTKVGQQTTVLNSLKTKLQAVQDSMAALNTSSVFNQRTTSASSTLWSASAAPEATAMSHTIAVSKLATAARLEGVGGISSAIRPDGDTSQVLISAMNVAQPVTAGEFSVNGARISVAVTDTWQDVLQRIGTATGGAVTASYDGATDRVTLSGAGTVVLGSANDTSNFLQAMRLNNNGTGAVSSAARLGAVKMDAPLASAGISGALALDGNNAGALLVNGVSIAYDADTDSLRTVIARINASSAGVSASYDAANDRMVLMNKVTGDLGVSVQDGTGNLASVLGLGGTSALVRGQNAEFTIDGGATRTSATNTLDENALGVSGLSVTIGSETTERISVGSDTTQARTKIEDFIKNYNEVLSYIDQQAKVTTSGTTVTAGLLYGNNAARDISTALRGEVFKALGGTGSIQRLESLGIDFNGTTNQLKIKDSAKLDSVLLTKAEDVTKFFTDTTNGLGTRLRGLIDRQTNSGSSLQQSIDLKVKRSSQITKQISDFQRHLDKQRASLEARFVQMERMQSLLQNQLTALNNAFPTTSSSSKK
jgi:flagellar hook-associated protein 2